VTQKIRQMRGPGMNKGQKRPRLAKFPNPDVEAKSKKVSQASAPEETTERVPSSYLSDTLVPSTRTRQAPRSGGKVTSTKTA